MYIACRELNLGGDKPVLVGERVDITAMHPVAVRSLLGMDWIKEVPDETEIILPAQNNNQQFEKKNKNKRR